MDGWLRQSSTRTLLVGPFVDDSDGNTEETGLTVTSSEVRLSKNGGNMAAKTEATSLVHDELGMYTCLIDATDTDTLGFLDLSIHESGALVVRHTYMVVTANVWDSLFAADTLQVHAVEIANDLITAASIAGDAIGATEIANGAIDAATFAAGAIDAAAIATDAIDADAVAAGAIVAGDIAAGAITASSIAADAIGSSELATTAVTEIRDAILDRVLSGNHDTGDTPGALLQLATDALAELTGIGDAPTTPTPAQALMLLYMWLRNDTAATATERRIKNNAGTEIMDGTMSDDGTTFSQGILTAP